MPEHPSQDPAPVDNGEVIRPRRGRISWTWLFPILAAAAAAWLFYSQWEEKGSKIYIQFDEAPGLQAGKTVLVYRGVNAGKVTDVKLDESLAKVVVTVQLEKFAESLARKGSDFWVNQPVISLGQTTGLESIITGNSIQARIGFGSPTTHFVGLEKPPLTPLEAPALVLQLRADDIPFLARGAPVVHRGVTVGTVEDKTLDVHGMPVLRVIVDKEFKKTVRTNSRFWQVPASSLQLGPGGIRLEIDGVKALLQGAIAFDSFGTPGETVEAGAEFILSPNEYIARANSEPIHVHFDDGRGILPKQTPVCYLGQPIGIVERAKPDPVSQSVVAVLRLQPGYEMLTRPGTAFTLVRFDVSLNGIVGTETLLTGAYIACAEAPPGTPASPAPPGMTFIGTTLGSNEWNHANKDNQDLRIRLEANNMPNFGPKTPILLRGIRIGSVETQSFESKDRPVLNVLIHREFAASVRKNSRFWQLPATSIKAGQGGMQLSVLGLDAILHGAIAMDVLETPGPAAQDGESFRLFPNEQTARANSEPISIVFQNGQGLFEGQTQLRYLGIPVGLVESVRPKNGQVEVTARLEPGYDNLRTKGTTYTVVRPKISIDGVSGLETITGGVYIDCVPGSKGPLARNFVGRTPIESGENAQIRSLEIVLSSKSTKIGLDAPVYYRGLQVGRVQKKGLSGEGGDVRLIVAIHEPYSRLVRENSKFWDVSGVRVSVGFLSLKVQTGTVDSLVRGGIEFSTPGPAEMGSSVKTGHVFPLHAEPQKEWLKWTSDIPLER